MDETLAGRVRALADEWATRAKAFKGTGIGDAYSNAESFTRALLDTPASAPVGDAEGLERLLYEHRQGALTCYDHPPTPEHPAWCCICGAHDLMVSWRAHVASHLAAFAAAQRAEALREAAEAIEAEAHRISGPGHLRAWWAIAQLRARADREARP